MAIVLGLALLGLLVGGRTGLVLGVLLGLGIRWALRVVVTQGLKQGQSQFLDATFSVMGALSKADGVVTRDEIEAAQHVFDMLRLPPDERDRAKASFNRGKGEDFDLDAEIDRLRGSVAFGRGPMLRLFLQIQVMTVTADGEIHAAEHAMLVRIARRLGLTERDVAQLEAMLRAGARSAGTGQAGAPPPSVWLEDAYTALGLTAAASDAEVKRAYRRLVSENHPDKLAARGLPESMRQVAEEKTREINVAYDLIKESRGFK
jgi:DnaJ like chaperone protein